MADIQFTPLIKPVITFDDAGLGRAMLDIWMRVARRGPPPDAIVGIGTGGLLCAEKLKDGLKIPVFACAMRRPSTITKRKPAYRAVLRSLPYAISNWARRIEDHYLASVAAKTPPTSARDNAQLVAHAAAINSAVTAQGLRHLLIIDDAVDSGATLACVVGTLRAALPTDIVITTAVISQTRTRTGFYPDVTLHRETLCRFPWSLDFRGV